MSTAGVGGSGAGIVAELVGALVGTVVLEAVEIGGARESAGMLLSVGEGAGMLLSAGESAWILFSVGEGAWMLHSVFSIGRSAASPECFVLKVFFLPRGTVSNSA